MIYLDNSATSWPKPDRVYRGVYDFMKKCGANPGRSGYESAEYASEVVYNCRELICNMFGLKNPSNVIFTKNTTEALNIVIKGVLNFGDHVVCTGMEHNSVLRPLEDLKKKGISYDVVMADESGFVSPDKIFQKVGRNTKLIVVNHVSNVCGTIQNIETIGDMARKRGILFLVDGAQSGGILNYTMENIDFLCLAGHKGLYGPMGTGVLCINTDVPIKPYTLGGTGSYSSLLSQPKELPDMLESGTVNAPGIAGLCEGLKFLRFVGIDEILNHERRLTKYFLEGLGQMKNIRVYGPGDLMHRTGVVSFNKEGRDCTEISDILSSKYGICTRAGYHCAYMAHCCLGTNETGTVRVSFGRFNTMDDVSKTLFAIDHV